MKRPFLNILLAVFILLASLWVLKKGVIPGWNDTATDFNNYFVASKLLSEGEEIHTFYDNANFASRAKEIGVEAGAKFAPFPPPTTILYYPLANFELITAKRIWLIFNLLLLILITIRIKMVLELPFSHAVFCMAIFFAPIASNLHFGQFYLLATYLLTEAYALLLKGKNYLLPGIIIGFMAAIKYLPLLFVGYAFRFGKIRWRLSLIILFTLLLINFIFFWLDPKAYSLFLHSFSHHLGGDLSGQGKFAVGFQSFDSLFSNIFILDTNLNPNPWFEAPALKILFKLLVFLCVSFMCFRLLQKEKFQFSAETISICLIGSFIIFPASATYHFTLLILPISLLFIWVFKNFSKKVFVVLMAIVLLTFSLQWHYIPNLWSWPKINLLIHFPRLWFLTVLFAYFFIIKVNLKHG